MESVTRPVMKLDLNGDVQRRPRRRQRNFLRKNYFGQTAERNKQESPEGKSDDPISLMSALYLTADSGVTRQSAARGEFL